MAAGRIRYDEDATHSCLELPGKMCSGLLGEKNVLDCVLPKAATRGGGRARSISSADDSAKLIAPCDHSPGFFFGHGRLVELDRLFLHDGHSAGPDRTAVLETAGPVLRLISGPEAASSIAVVLNLSTGSMRFIASALACRN